MNINEAKDALRELLAMAREQIDMAEHYEKKARSYLVPASAILASAGMPTEPETLRALLSKREDVYSAEGHADKAIEALIGKAEPVATPAEVRT